MRNKSPEAKKINKELENVYSTFLEDFNSGEYTLEKYTNPVLMQCWDEYVADKNLRILFVDTESPKWYDDNNCKNKLPELLSMYEDANLGYGKKSKFFDLAHSVNNNVNPDFKDGHNFLWTNLFKIGRKEVLSLKERRAWEELNLDLLRKELEIIKPKCVCFLTNDGAGADTTYIKRVVSKDILFLPTEGQEDIATIVNRKKKMDTLMYFLPSAVCLAQGAVVLNAMKVGHPILGFGALLIKSAVKALSNLIKNDKQLNYADM